MPTIGAILVEVSRDLNDQEPGYEYERWSIDMLMGYLNDALRQIAIRRPDEMVAEVSIPLVPGERQTLPSQYRSIIDIMSTRDDSCGQGARMTRGEWDAFAAFNMPACTPGAYPAVSASGVGRYHGRDWFYNPNMPRTFYVWPPVPITTSGPAVTASVVIAPPEYTTGQFGTQLPDPWLKYASAVIAWMKHRAYSVDSESVLSQNKAAAYMGEFREALGISQASDSRHKSGWNQGQLGNGDPQAARR